MPAWCRSRVRRTRAPSASADGGRLAFWSTGDVGGGELAAERSGETDNRAEGGALHSQRKALTGSPAACVTLSFNHSDDGVENMQLVVCWHLTSCQWMQL